MEMEQPRSLPPLPPAETENPSPAMADTILAETLNRLSVQERSQVLEDVHGVGDMVDEPPEFVEQRLQELETEISRIPKPQRASYDQALHQSADYVTNRKFRLKFLRAESFQCRHAATRMVAYLDAKLLLFGLEKLTRDIGLADLDEDDLACLKSGYMQLLPTRDRAGRAIIFCIPRVAKYRVLENKLRTFWYLIMAALEDEDTQRRGVIGLVYNLGPKRIVDRLATWNLTRLGMVLPFRFGSLHFCYNDDERMRLVVALITTVTAASIRARLRQHIGSHVECIYSLMTFGIPTDSMPVTHSGDVKLANHKDFLHHRRAQELSGPTKLERIIIPRPMDILLGRGKGFNDSTGNLRFQNIIESHVERYERADRFEKTVVAEMIIAFIQQNGNGRFLKRDNAGWLEAPNEQARDKIGHAFRNRRLLLVVNNNRNNIQSGTSLDMSRFTVETTSKVASSSMLSRPFPSYFGCLMTASSLKRQRPNIEN